MTTRLYFQDSYIKRFDALVLERLEMDGHPAIILDKTAFYPSGGGQPHDTGKLQKVDVLSVVRRGDDGQIAHILADEIADTSVRGEIDWERRFDHMQHHTGQHLLSQSFQQLAGHTTIGFHLGAEYCTLDLDSHDIDDNLLKKVEQFSNRVIWENRPIRSRMVDHEEAALLTFRSRSRLDEEKIRLVEIADFDLTACGGTHVSRTGEIGLIKIIRRNRGRKGARIEFLCGGRAVSDYSRKNNIISILSTQLTTSQEELNNSVASMRADNRGFRRKIKNQEKRLIELEVEDLYSKGHQRDGILVVRAIFSDRDPGQMLRIAKLVAQKPLTACLLGLAGKKSLLVFARSTDVKGNMKELIGLALGDLGNASGGGTPELAQGGGPSASNKKLSAILMAAEQRLIM